MVLVEVQGQLFDLSSDGSISEGRGVPSIIVLKDVSKEALQEYSRMGIKVFLCEGEVQECLIKLLRIVYPECKTCKFQ
jgi:hypothetical protein